MSIKNSDIETLYTKIESRINLIGSYVEDPGILPKIMKSCRLKPYTIFSGSFQSRFVFEPHWVDEFGNSLMIQNKSIKIIMNDLRITKNTKISTDLFYGRSVDRTATESKCALIVNGKDYTLVCFYGKDEYLRNFILFEEVARVSPLLLGISALKEFFKHIHDLSRQDINKNKIDLPIKTDVVNCVVCWQPASWKDYIEGALK